MYSVVQLQDLGDIISLLVYRNHLQEEDYLSVKLAIAHKNDSAYNRFKASFLRLNIAKKLLVGYIPLPIIIILISAFALSSLQHLNDLNESITRIDLPAIESADKMMDNLLAQELYGRRYAILKSSDMLILFWQRSDEFDNLAAQISLLSIHYKAPIKDILSLHEEYNKILLKSAEPLRKRAAKAEESNVNIKKAQEELISAVKKIATEARRNQNTKALKTLEISKTAFRVTALLCVSGLLLGVGSTVIITRNISGSVNHLKQATMEISEGRFDYKNDARSQDELGDLSNSFNEMTNRLKRLEEMYLDASPLTRLPGGMAIENILQKRIDADAPMAFCFLDLDNFKAFNDRYGYANGSEVIKATAHVIENAAINKGTGNDFVGHIGGDDFAIITSIEHYSDICNTIIEDFDKTIPSFYEEEDRQRGYIKGKTRQGVEMNFPIMTISIAVVTNKDRKFTSVVEIGEVAAELKDYAKSLPGSIYVIDKRRKSLDLSIEGSTGSNTAKDKLELT